MQKEKTNPTDRELDILERGLVQGGIKLGFTTKAERDSFRMRLYRRRDRDRREAAITADKPVMKGLSPYDTLAMTYYLTKQGTPAMHIHAGEAFTILEEGE